MLEPTYCPNALIMFERCASAASLEDEETTIRTTALNPGLLNLLSIASISLASEEYLAVSGFCLGFFGFGEKIASDLLPLTACRLNEDLNSSPFPFTHFGKN